MSKHKDAIKNDLFRDFYNQAPSSAIGDSLSVFVLAYLLYGLVSQPYLVSWFSFAQTLNVFLLVLFVIFKVRKPDNDSFSFWRNSLYVIAIFHGTAWGLLGVLAYTAADVTVFYLSIVVIMGLGAASISVMGPIFPVYIIHKALFFSPTIYLSMVTATTAIEYAIPLFMFSYFVFLIMTGYYHSKNINEMLQLRESNSEMLSKLGSEIEERKLVEVQLRNAIDIAESANKAKTQFLANMSHEIRTPLTAVIGFSELLKDPDIDPLKRDDKVNTIVRNGRHLLSIINNILDLTKIESDKLDVEEIVFSPVQEIKEIEEVFRPIIEEKGVEFCTEFDFPLPRTVVSDPVRLRQILFNLLGNANKFTSEGQIKLSLEFDEKNQQILVKVADTGIGLSQVQRKNIFTPFNQADSSTTRKYGGTGLGLTISRRLAKILGGDLKVNSNIGQGSEFTLSLDYTAPEDEQFIYDSTDYMSDEKMIDAIVNYNFSGNILVAEDTIEIQELVNIYLENTLIQLTFVDNGQKAVSRALREDYDLILMDMQMPIMDGIEASKTLREKEYHKPIVAMTANTFVDDINEYRNAGINEILAKPFNKSELFGVLSNYLKTEEIKGKKQSDRVVRRKKSMQKLTTKFLEKLPEMLLELSEGIRNQDSDVICRRAHILKGLGGGFGYPEISELAAIIEQLGKEGDFNGATQYFNRLELVYSQSK